MNGNNIALNKLFTRNSLWKLINSKGSELYELCIQQYSLKGSNTTNKEIISSIYRYLMKEYRNEYFYKNTLLNKLLLARHSLHTTTALNEVPISKSKADFVLINGKAIVYEIKTELDSFERLDSQINDYYKAFKHVCVVTCESNYEKIRGMLKDTPVGICILTKRNTISMRKEPEDFEQKLNHTLIFKVLRKKEYENILMKHYGELPDTTQMNYYKACLEWFENIEINIAHSYMIGELRKRNIKEVEEYRGVPYELKFLVYFSSFKKKDYTKLNDFLYEHWRE
ncbi:sce7726 family protein [Oceanobacillus alkalisoli]|uniref:sce7726 family protein n=1 Tax=Oceanobacillus alkalisoli TaxID=2925113 RepID=UPI001F11A5D7|nr:sce7726 family protein [Oceanobacillus alkalisoli]MCF3942587.1 sce7726 family protein [Oceanobacillus alkalisoli]